MWLAIVETIGLVFVGGAAIVGIGKYTARVQTRLNEHDIMLREHENNQVRISDSLERTVVAVAILEERTKTL